MPTEYRRLKMRGNARMIAEPVDEWISDLSKRVDSA